MKIPLLLKAFNSPFVRPKLFFYYGKTAIGTPYFFPRNWVKYTKQDCIDQALKSMQNSNTDRTFDQWVGYYKNYSKPVPKRIGFDFVDLGWKTKWSDTDFRHEFNPRCSFVFFGYQLAITFVPLEDCHYWECFLYYNFATDKTKSSQERISQSISEFPCVWTSHSDTGKETIDYWTKILKK